MTTEPSDDGGAQALIPPEFSEDQAAAIGLIADALSRAGVNLAAGNAKKLKGEQEGKTVAVLGKAGSGKTHLLAWLVDQLIGCGATQIVQEFDSRKKSAKKAVTFAVVAPTNKAASVLRTRGVAATTIHRILYSPLYDPDYEALAEWLSDPAANDRPDGVAGVSADALDRALAFYQRTKSSAAALASVGLRGADFITGWKRRDEALSIGLVDEASMLDERALDDLQEVFSVVILFGDPAQLAPVGQSGEMAFEKLPAADRHALSRVHRQAKGNPIIDLAYALQDDIEFQAFERMIERIAAEDERVVIEPRVNADLMARSPVLVWRNSTRIRLIAAFRAAHGLGDDALAPGEPLICDGVELAAKNRDKRVDLEQAGLVKGAQAFWLGPGKKPGFARIYVAGAPSPKMSAAAIIQIEKPGEEEPFIPTAARQGAVFVHGAACTVHKAQGSQWPTVQVFAPDLFAAARAGRVEAGAPLWRRLAYVAITRAEEKLVWATRYALRRPAEPLAADDLDAGPLL
ncbi:MAG: AAA family ATPase [Neomegalonema sp.]|nr:AAA family ATPase [Neomegalonema sp.]